MDERDLPKMEGLQRKLEGEIGGKPGVLGIGIGLNEKEDDYALNVFVADPGAAKDLPKTIGDAEVVYKVIGGIKAF